MKFKQAIWFLIPSFCGLLIFYLWPFAGSLHHAFLTNVGGTTQIGFSNFANLLKSELFRMSIANTGVFILCNVPVVVFLSFLLANLVWGSTRLGTFFRGSLVLTYMLPVAALVSMWSLLFDTAGPVNQFLSLFGIERIHWLTGGNMLRWPVILMYIWKNTGFNMIIMLAGLNAIDKHVIEAAMVDSAGWFRRQVSIIAPQMFPTIFFVTVLSIVNSLKIFKEAYLFGGAYPEDSIYTVQHFINNQFFQFNYAMVVASSLIFISIIFIAVFVLFKVEKRYREGV